MTSTQNLPPQELLGFLNRALLLQEELAGLEQSKYNCISRSDVKELLEHVQKEQALTLRTRAQEQEFLQLAQRAGKPGATVRSLVDELDEAHRAQGEALYDKLFSRLQDVKELVFRCNTLCELRLRRVEALSQAEKAPKGQKTGALHISKTI